MIRALFVVGSIWMCSHGIAQGVPEAEINIKKLNKLRGKENIVPVPGTNSNLQSLLTHKSQELSPVYVGSNARGEVYELPQDNMPMLKPYLPQENVMPGTEVRKQTDEADLPGKIPNSIRPKVYRFVPDNQPLKK
jgi:hypothetical protein